MSAPHDVTQILRDWSAGDAAAPEKLMPLVYEELRRLARSYLARERSDHTLQATALVHEAYLRMVDGALESFAQDYPRKSEVVELKFFAGLDAKEISEVLQVSEKTVLRDWNFAKLWLCRELSE